MNKNKKQQLLEYTQLYFKKKHGDTSYFNFNILPLITNFSFVDFLTNSTKSEHSGILIITDNQYIIGYTDSYGLGTHKASMARIMKDITGGGYIKDVYEAKTLEKECTKQFLTARINYDYRGYNENGTDTYIGAIYFKLPEGNMISINQFEIFKQFYEDYNPELEMIINKYGMNKFNIQYEYIDSHGTKIIKKTNSLKEVCAYYENCVKTNHQPKIANEVILGVVKKEEQQKIKRK